MKTLLLTRVLLTILLLCGVVAAPWACDTPVYQYALTRWQASSYQVRIFHRGALSAADRTTVTALRHNADMLHANLQVITVDLAVKPDAAQHAQFTAQHGMQLPWMAIYYPPQGSACEDAGTCPLPVETALPLAWAGPFDADTATALLDSPLRRQLTRLLLTRETIPWVMLDSGNRRKDDAAAYRLQSELAKLRAAPPVIASAAGQDVAAPVRLTFPLRRVSRTDPAERMLIELLLSSESGLRGLQEPIVFPIFGRGIVLYALAGAGINGANIRTAVEFMTGACSCEVKAQNPGIDLLMATDWETRLKEPDTADTPPPAGLSEFVARAQAAKHRAGTPPAKLRGTPVQPSSVPATPAVVTTKPTIAPVKTAMPLPGTVPPTQQADRAKVAAISATLPPAPVPVTPPQPERIIPTPPTAKAPAPLTRNLVMLFGAVLVGVLTASAVLKSRKRKDAGTLI